jgi:succinoglycan biosynthesis protein ExoM
MRRETISCVPEGDGCRLAWRLPKDFDRFAYPTMKIAICICTCGRADPLRRLLEALAGMELGLLDPSSIFIVVVDNQPDGRAREVCSRARERLPFALHFVEEPERGISFARNRAMATAIAHDAAFISCIDDDDLPRSDWLLRLVERQWETRVDLVLGVWELPPDFTLPAWLSDIDFLRPPPPEDLHKIGTPYGLPYCSGTFNVLIRREVIEELAKSGPVFSPEFGFIGGEDIDFFIRAQRRGFTLVPAPASVVRRYWEPERLTLRGVLRRGFRLGSAQAHIDRLHLSIQHHRRRRHRARKKLLRRTISLPRRLLKSLTKTSGPPGWFAPSRLVARLHNFTRAIGTLHGRSGRKFRYYG